MSAGRAARRTAAVAACGLLGGALLIAGLVLMVGLPGILKDQVAKNVKIQPDTFFFKLWRDLPVPFYFSIYFFEVLNPDEVFAGEKPAVQQRGPYVYRETREKTNITFHENGTVSFLEYRCFHFQPDMSNGTEEDYVVIPNLLVLAAAVLVEDLKYPLQIAVSTAFSFFKQKAFLNRTVGEVLWGYDDPLVKLLNTIKPGLLPFKDKFGILVGFNNSHMGRFTVNTGVNDISKVQMVDTWNGFKKVSFWRSDQCNQINGTSGEIWPPFMTPSSPVEFYSTDACRSLKLQFREPGEFQGVPVYRYVAPNTWFANGTDYPPNEGFCPCRQSGIQNMSSCRLGVPMFLSQPHFYNGDPTLLETVDGLHPSEEKHGTFLEINPLTGVPFNVSVKLQLSLFIKRVPLITQTGHIKPVVLPILWFEERGVINDGLLNHFYEILVLVPIVLGYGQYVAVVLGSVILISLAFLWFRSKWSYLVYICAMCCQCMAILIVLQLLAPVIRRVIDRHIEMRRKFLQTVDPQNRRPQDPASAPLLKKDLSPNIHADD